MATTMRGVGPSLLMLAAATWVLGAGVAPPSAGAQTIIRTAPNQGQPAAGWVGINIRTEYWGPAEAGGARLVIRHVVDGSPADEAGLVPGEQILRLNGQPATFEAFSRLASGLRPGDRFLITVAREGWEGWAGWTREVRLEAAPKPAPELVSLSGEMVVRLESAMERLDSLRVRIGPGAQRSVEVRTTAARPLVLGTTRMVAVGPDSTRTVILFPAGPERAVAYAVGTSASVIGVGTRVPVPDADREADSYRFLFGEPDSAELRRRQTQLWQAPELRRGFESLLEGVGIPDQALSRSIVPTDSIHHVFRPLMPYIVGQNRVAGAALAPLNRELAAYFAVANGLLVTDVTEGTPADEAGLLPGDVVVRVGEVGVASLDDVRRALSQAAPEGQILHLVRHGRPVRVTLPR